jgi:hypothetical protein
LPSLPSQQPTHKHATPAASSFQKHDATRSTPHQQPPSTHPQALAQLRDDAGNADRCCQKHAATKTTPYHSQPPRPTHPEALAQPSINAKEGRALLLAQFCYYHHTTPQPNSQQPTANNHAPAGTCAAPR